MMSMGVSLVIDHRTIDMYRRAMAVCILRFEAPSWSQDTVDQASVTVVDQNGNYEEQLKEKNYGEEEEQTKECPTVV